MPTRHMLRQRTDASRRRRVAFFILPLGGEPEEREGDYSGRVWHARADHGLDAEPDDAPPPPPPPDPLQLPLPLS